MARNERAFEAGLAYAQANPLRAEPHARADAGGHRRQDW